MNICNDVNVFLYDREDKRESMLASYAVYSKSFHN